MSDQIDSLLSLSGEDLFQCFFPLDSDQGSDSFEPTPLPDLSVEQAFSQSDFLEMEVKPALSPLTSSGDDLDYGMDVQKKRKNNRKGRTNKKPKSEGCDSLIDNPYPLIERKIDTKYLKRLEANKKSAQASRERKKILKSTLEQQVSALSEENTQLQTDITELETENKVLKREFIHLQEMINNSGILSKISTSTKAEEIADHPEKQNNTLAAMYLLIVLHSFKSYFNTAPDQNINFFPGEIPKAIPSIV